MHVVGFGYTSGKGFSVVILGIRVSVVKGFIFR